MTRGEEALRHHEARLADARQQIAGFETAFKHERASAQAAQAEVLKVGRQRAEIGFRIRVIEADAARARPKSRPPRSAFSGSSARPT